MGDLPVSLIRSSSEKVFRVLLSKEKEIEIHFSSVNLVSVFCFEKEGKQDEGENERGRCVERRLGTRRPETFFLRFCWTRTKRYLIASHDESQTRQPDTPPDHPEDGVAGQCWYSGVSG